ncbi:MAG: integration host factor subunit beta [Holosporales bacterium]|jgi:integration host factor subunit beta
MTRSELVTTLAALHPDFSLRVLDDVVNTLLDTIVDSLANGKRVELRGFGTFSIRHRDARQGRNPRSGESVAVAAKTVPFFKAGKQLRQRLNGELVTSDE